LIKDSLTVVINLGFQTYIFKHGTFLELVEVCLTFVANSLYMMAVMVWLVYH